MTKVFSTRNIIIAILSIMAALIAIFVQPLYLFGILALMGFIYLISRNLIWGIYLMALFYPFISLQISFGREINLPMVDILAIIVFVAWTFKLITDQQSRPAKFPGLIYFSAFFIVGVLSFYHAGIFEYSQTLLSLKYLLRPIIFFYLMFVVLPFNIIKQEKQLINILGIFYLLGILISCMGTWSTIFMHQTVSIIPRAIPFDIAGIYPLGTNQNLIAETLIGIIPLAWILVKKAQTFKAKFWLSTGLIFMNLITLLTFSRAGWLVLLLEAIFIFYYEYLRGKKINKQNLALILSLIFVVLLSLGFLMYDLISSPVTESSNRNRLGLMRITWESLQRHPWIGQGVGTFQKIVSYDYAYILEFGAPMEAHGFMQKILAEMGILGLVVFALVVFFIFNKIYVTYKQNKNNYLVFGLLISVLGCFVFQLFNTSYYISKLWLVAGLGLVATKLYLKQTYEK